MTHPCLRQAGGSSLHEDLKKFAAKFQKGYFKTNDERWLEKVNRILKGLIVLESGDSSYRWANSG
jgi:hypothetical protein